MIMCVFKVVEVVFETVSVRFFVAFFRVFAFFVERIFWRKICMMGVRFFGR